VRGRLQLIPQLLNPLEGLAMLSFLNAPIGLAYHIVFALAQLLAPLGAGLGTAAAIVVFTAAVRLLLSPLSYRAYRGQAAMSTLQPKIAGLRKRYGSQPERLQRELTALYRAEGGGLLAGCLPLLIQLPFFSVMYRLFLSSTVAGRANDLLTRSLLGTPLGSHWLAGAGPVSMQGLLFAGLFALIGGVAFLTARATRQLGPGLAGTGLARTGPAIASAGGARPASARTASGNTGAAADQPPGLGLLARLLPYSTVVIAALVPLAAGLYLLTTTTWTAVERALMRRWFPPSHPDQPGRPAAKAVGHLEPGS
jgi:YidC/Oxa1 family membrane protein insertase